MVFATRSAPSSLVVPIHADLPLGPAASLGEDLASWVCQRGIPPSIAI